MKRYRQLLVGGGLIEEDPDGEWVKWKDVL